jgi:hypothetical protein
MMKTRLAIGHRPLVVLLLAAAALFLPAPASAQFPAPPTPPAALNPPPPKPAAPKPVAVAPKPPRPPKPGELQTDPIRCWWKADRTSVRVGERFGLTLTCGVIETGPITVVPAINQLEGGALALTPFDVVSSVRREDVRSPPWRYFQFEYVLRLLSDGFFGQDVNIPALTVTYNLKAEGGETEGRDQSYILPALPMKVMSIVPRAAGDIRDASDQTFALIESRRFRSSAGMVASGVLYVFALILVGLAVVAGTARFRTRTSGAVKPVAAPSMLAGSLKALEEVRSQSASGWTPELARQALSALRVGGAVALGRPVAQEFVDGDTNERAGQVTVRTGLLRPRLAMLSASTTAPAIAWQLANGHRSAGFGGFGRTSQTGSAKSRPKAARRATLEQLADSLLAFNAAAYGRAAGSDSVALNAALAQGTDAIKRLKSTTMWPVRLFN